MGIKTFLLKRRLKDLERKDPYEKQYKEYSRRKEAEKRAEETEYKRETERIESKAPTRVQRAVKYVSTPSKKSKRGRRPGRYSVSKLTTIERRPRTTSKARATSRSKVVYVQQPPQVVYASAPPRAPVRRKKKRRKKTQSSSEVNWFGGGGSSGGGSGEIKWF